MIVDFSPVPALAGGALIGLAASALLYFNGRIAGVSGIFGGVLEPGKGETLWRVAFLAGLFLAGIVFLRGRSGAFELPRSLAVIAVGGFLVGLGTRLANGCTSGHGICGNARFSKRSLAATATFMAFGAMTVFIAERVLGGAL